MTNKLLKFVGISDSKRISREEFVITIHWKRFFLFVLADFFVTAAGTWFIK